MRVVNARKVADKSKVFYVGRNPQKYGFAHNLQIGGYQGNHFVVGVHGERGECVKLYKRWLWERIKANDRTVIEPLLYLEEGDTLACWCHPEPCHADVIVAAAKWLQSNKETK